MTTITFKPDSAHQFVNWNDPARWTGGVVPNDPAVDVIIPTTIVVATGNPYTSFITESGAFAVGSLAISNNDLLLNGTLTVTHDLNISAGGEIDMGAGSLSAASIDNNGIDIQGGGSINVTGLFLNQSQVVGNGLSLTAGSLTNSGSLVAASGNLTVTVSPVVSPICRAPRSPTVHTGPASPATKIPIRIFCI
jgi:adhesin HecA-like repeat protein